MRLHAGVGSVAQGSAADPQVAGSEVLVPLCGKSRDKLWLASAGHTVMGVELSPIAVDHFFKEHGLQAEVRTEGPFTIKQSGPITIWCGDFFALPAAAVERVAAVYDRASLVAFPPALQSRYVRKLADTLPPPSRGRQVGAERMAS